MDYTLKINYTMEEIRAFYLKNRALDYAVFEIKCKSGASVRSKLLGKGQSGMIDLSQEGKKFKNGDNVWLEVQGVVLQSKKRPGFPDRKPLTFKSTSSKVFIYREESLDRANYVVIAALTSRLPVKEKFSLRYLGLERYFDAGTDTNDAPVQVDGIYYYLNAEEKTALVAENPAKYKGKINVPGNFSYKGVKYGVNGIFDSAFNQCTELTKVTIPDTVKSIGVGAFGNCTGLVKVEVSTASGIQSGLASVDIPDGVKVIDTCSFIGCTSIDSIVLPSSVETICMMAFEGCTSLTRIVVERATPPKVEDKAFEGVDKSDCTVYVPEGSKTKYKSDKNWKDFIIFES